jgi:hypothetical protein
LNIVLLKRPGVCQQPLLAVLTAVILRSFELVRQRLSLRTGDYLLVSIQICHLMLIRARNGKAYTEVEYDPTEGVEVLNSQLASIFSDVADDTDFLLVDYAG